MPRPHTDASRRSFRSRRTGNSVSSITLRRVACEAVVFLDEVELVPDEVELLPDVGSWVEVELDDEDPLLWVELALPLVELLLEVGTWVEVEFEELPLL